MPEPRGERCWAELERLQSVRRQPVPLHDLLAQVAKDLAARVAESGADLNIPDDLPIVRGDPTSTTESAWVAREMVPQAVKARASTPEQPTMVARTSGERAKAIPPRRLTSKT